MSKIILRPTRGRIVVRPTKEEEVTAAGIIMPDSVHAEFMNQGEVLSIGPPRIIDTGEEIFSEFEVGDLVVYHPRAGTPYAMDGVHVLLMTQDDVMVVVEESR